MPTTRALLAALLLAGCAAHAPTPFADSASLAAAHAALDRGEAATALGIAHGVLAIKPNDSAALAAAGDADAILGNRRTAESEYRAALAAAPGFPRAALGLAKLALAQNPAQAEHAFRRVLAADPHSAAALTDLGVALDLQARHAEAQASYNAALAADPNLASARVDLAVSLALAGQGQAAEGLLHDAAEGATISPRIRADYALAEVVAGHPEDARRTLTADLSEGEAQASVIAMQALR